MPFSSIGDMRQHFLTSRTNSSLTNELNTLVQELTNGEKSDLTQHLGAGQTQLSGIDRHLDMLSSFARSNVSTGQMLSAMQSALENAETQRGTVSSALLTIDESSSSAQVQEAGSIARSGFDTVVQSLNIRFGDRAMFGGNDLNQAPLVDADTMLADIETAVTGLTSASDITAAIDDWFDQAGGGFETLAYQGDNTGFMNRPTNANSSIEIDVRADDQSFRDMFKAFAKSTIAGDQTNTLDDSTRQEMQMQAGVDLLSVASPLSGLRGRVGFAESQIEEASVRVAAQQTSYSIARNDLVSADPYETAIRLESVQLQLETHYTLTARLSRLSLTEYLR